MKLEKLGSLLAQDKSAYNKEDGSKGGRDDTDDDPDVDYDEP